MKSLALSFTTAFVGAFSFAHASGESYEKALFWGLGCACVTVTAHRVMRVLDPA